MAGPAESGQSGEEGGAGGFGPNADTGRVRALRRMTRIRAVPAGRVVAAGRAAWSLVAGDRWLRRLPPGVRDRYLAYVRDITSKWLVGNDWGGLESTTSIAEDVGR
jgi:hypothetical protein